MSTWRRAKLVPGVYDEVLTARWARELEALADVLVTKAPLERGVDSTLATRALLFGALELALDVAEGDADALTGLTREVLEVVQRHAPRSLTTGEIVLEGEHLLAVTPRNQAAPTRPRGSLLTSSLIVNAEGDALLDHLRSEFDSADRIDLLVAFIKQSGFERLKSAIERHCVARGRPLRVLTTTYLGASDAKAIEALAKLRNVEVRVSYDDQSTRLHAKAWVFHRDSGLSTAYVGSSNLSQAAQTDGLEWNVRLTDADQPALLSQMVETFEQYWQSPAMFEPFDAAQAPQVNRLRRALAQDPAASSPGALLELLPRDFQKPVLEELEAARALGRHRNLLVAATGTGKTVMAALDYRALRARGRVDSLLFVAHRREILEQARHTYRAALQVPTFGELLVGGHEVDVGRHVFASIEMVRQGGQLDPAAFDMVVVDEAHHAAADTWEALLARVEPKELLGLTGTPERADGLDYQAHFPRPWVGNLRVWNAIPHALVPFRYYALDVAGVDLRDVAWTQGRYATAELSGKLVGAAEVFVQKAAEAVACHVARPESMRAIAFCVDVRHAEEVARQLGRHFKTQVLTGQTPANERQRARDDLNLGAVQVLCVVDIYNEGVDVPNVNTLFFFRPTESATVFLQQLGRGLRRAHGKPELVVFDLTGRQRPEFRFDRRLRALLGATTRQLRQTVKDGFGHLPTGCHLHFDEHSQRDVLAQIERAIPQSWSALQSLAREPSYRDLALAAFLREAELEPNDLYAKGRSFDALKRAVGHEARPLGEGEASALQMLPKLTHVGDAARLDAWERLARLERPGTEVERRLMHMLFVSVYGLTAAGADGAWQMFQGHALLREELLALIPVLRRHNALLAPAEVLEPDIPLALHARYLGAELSAAFDARTQQGNFRQFYQGLARVQEGRYELLLVTLEKDERQAAHLRYRDFPLNERRFHWQSQSSTTQASPAGQRLLHPAAHGTTPLLFVRERADERPGVTMGFRYLGPVSPARFEGERPITIEWDLPHAMPRDLLQAGRVAA